jgi:hypothetical protein
MRALTLSLVATLALSGCVNPPDFGITIMNTGTVTTYLDAGDSSGVLMKLEQEIAGAWRPLSPSLAFMCIERCGVPGQIVCAAVAAELLVAHALLPGDETLKMFDGERWYETDAGCAQRANLTGPLRVTVWHDDAIVDFNGDPVAEPTTSGTMGDGGGEVMLEEAVPQSMEFDLTGRSTVVIEVSE